MDFQSSFSSQLDFPPFRSNLYLSCLQNIVREKFLGINRFESVFGTPLIQSITFNPERNFNAEDNFKKKDTSKLLSFTFDSENMLGINVDKKFENGKSVSTIESRSSKKRKLDESITKNDLNHKSNYLDDLDQFDQNNHEFMYNPLKLILTDTEFNNEIIEKIVNCILNFFKYQESVSILIIGSPGAGKSCYVEEAIRRVEIKLQEFVEDEGYSNKGESNYFEPLVKNNLKNDDKGDYIDKIKQNCTLDSFNASPKSINLATLTVDSQCSLEHKESTINDNYSNSSIKRKTKNFLIVRVYCKLCTDEIACLKYIVRKLSLLMGHDAIGLDTTKTSAEKNVEILQKLIQDICTYSKSRIIIILDGFEKFVAGHKQLLLYTLFDLSHMPGVYICILAISSDLKVSEYFEKRVRSRFNPEWIYIPEIDSINILLSYLFRLLLINKNEIQMIYTKSTSNLFSKCKVCSKNESIVFRRLIDSYNCFIIRELMSERTKSKLEFELLNGKGLQSIFNTAVEFVLSLIPSKNCMTKFTAIFDDSSLTQSTVQKSNGNNFDEDITQNQTNISDLCDESKRFENKSVENNLERNLLQNKFDDERPYSYSQDYDSLILSDDTISIKKPIIDVFSGKMNLADIHIAYIKRILLDLNEIEHIILCAFCRIHFRQVVPKHFARILEEITSFFKVCPATGNFMASKISTYSLPCSLMSYRKEYIKLIDMGVLEVSMCHEVHNKAFKSQLLSDSSATFLPIKFPFYQLYMEMLPSFSLPSSIENWLQNKIQFF